MSRGNGYGTARTTRERDLALHDGMPPWLRFVGNYAVAKWDAAGLLVSLQKRRLDGMTSQAAMQDLLAMIARVERADTIRAYGPTHPEAV